MPTADAPRGPAGQDGAGHRCPPALTRPRLRLAEGRAGRALRRHPRAQAGRAALHRRRARRAAPPRWSSRARRARGQRDRAASSCRPRARRSPGWPTPTSAIPRGALTVVGITGTNGKTTTSLLVDALLRARGRPDRPDRHHRVSDRRRSGSRRARRRPRRSSCSRCSRAWSSAGVAGVAMEVSSHALALSPGGRHRVRRRRLHQPDPGPPRLPRDARRLPRRQGAPLPPARRGRASPAAPRWSMPTIRRGRRWWRGSTVPTAHLRPRPRGGRSGRGGTRSGMDGIRMDVDTPGGRLEIASPLVGEHNVMNLLGADRRRARARDGAATVIGGRARRRERRARPVRARGGGPALPRRRGLRAHARRARARARHGAQAPRRRRAPRAWSSAAAAIATAASARSWAAIAARLADRAWVTSDNPRSERPEAIVAEIVAGIPRRGRGPPRSHEPDRRAAIRAALDVGARRATSW